MEVNNKISTSQKISTLGGNTKGLYRREFLNQILRYGILGGILLLTGFILLKRKVTVESNCTENFACNNCKKYSNCKLPEKG